MRARPGLKPRLNGEIELFKKELLDRQDEIRRVLPQNIALQRFIDASLLAVASNPGLMLGNRLSLHAAIIKAAQDGLLPDGKEGRLALNPRTKSVEWHPMVYGLRKRFLELGNMILDADVVHENDEWEWERGDNSFIRHKPVDVRTRKPRGQMCATYCIVRDLHTREILHREVMDWEEINKIKNMLANKESELWTTHEKEAWKKSVIHRLAKVMPLVPELAAIFDRENEYVDWEAEEAYARDQREPPAGADRNDNPLRDPEIDLSDDGPVDDYNQDPDPPIAADREHVRQIVEDAA